jgi:hypothetical protein
MSGADGKFIDFALALVTLLIFLPILSWAQ